MSSRLEMLLSALLNGEQVDIEPRTRIEQYLKNCCDKCGCDNLPTPRSRVEILFYQLAEQLAGGGGSPSEPTTNKLPQIIDRTVTEITAEDLAGVTEIGNYAFADNNNLMSVTVPNNVTNIDGNAFDKCYKLVEVINKSSLNIKKGGSIFNGNPGMITSRALEVHKGDSKIVNKNGYFFYPYEGVNYLVNYIGTDTELTLPANYNGENYVINQYAFVKGETKKDDKITSVTIPDSVTSIGYRALYNYISLANVMIGKGVTSIASTAFYGCSALTDIYIDAPEDSISDAPWGAPNSPTIHWNTPLPTEEE
jgi:hypothetical protein